MISTASSSASTTYSARCAASTPVAISTRTSWTPSTSTVAASYSTARRSMSGGISRVAGYRRSRRRRRRSALQEAARRAGRRTMVRRVPVAADSLGGRATLFSQPGSCGLNSLAEVVRELVEVSHDVLAHDPSSFVWRHRVEFFGGDQPGRVRHVTRVSVARADTRARAVGAQPARRCGRRSPALERALPSANPGAYPCDTPVI